jgi:hypothetical protein
VDGAWEVGVTAVLPGGGLKVGAGWRYGFVELEAAADGELPDEPPW